MVQYERDVRESLKYLPYAPILFISALTGQRVKKILEAVDHVSEQAKKRISTSPLNKYFRGWIEKFPPALYKNRGVKMNYITQVSTAPPTFVIVTNMPEGIHFSYERYLLNQMRETFGFDGVPVRFLFRKKGKEK